MIFGVHRGAEVLRANPVASTGIKGSKNPKGLGDR